MKLFADTADIEEIEFCFSKNVNDGITTNPKLMETAGINNFEEACQKILDKYSKVPVSLETDLRGIPVKEIDMRVEEVKDVLVDQAHSLSKLGENVVVKIPICKAGIMAVEELSNEGIKTNVTVCMTPYQALTAAKAGATYVSLFANRMLDSHIFVLSGNKIDDLLTTSWKETVAANKEKYFQEAWEKTLEQIAYVANKIENMNSNLIVGSIRSPEDVYKIAFANPQIITIPTKIVKELKDVPSLKQVRREIMINNLNNNDLGNSLNHPMSTYTIEEFEKAADSYRKNLVGVMR